MACLVGHPGIATAHDIPADVTVRLLLRPAGNRLQVVVRTPLAALRDLDFPERARGYLDVEKLTPLLDDAVRLWIADFIEIREDDTRLPRPSIAATRVSMPSDRSFTSFEAALARVKGPKLSNADDLVWNQVFLDVLLEYPIRSDHGPFSIRPGLEGLGAKVLTVVQFAPVDGSVRAYEFTGDPGLVPLDPRWHQAALRFVRLGFLHILDGIDHLLFLLCLVIPVRRVRPLLVLVTAFTVAHSFTLGVSALGWVPAGLWFPPLIELSIAVSVLYVALENIVGANRRARWITAFAFGLVHGFGFSFALRESLQFAGSHLLASLVSFNLGVELGQLAVLLVLVPALDLLFRFVVAERIGAIVLSALAAHVAWHWMEERWAVLRRFPLPALDTGFLAGAARWLLAILVLAAALRMAFRGLESIRWPACRERFGSASWRRLR